MRATSWTIVPARAAGGGAADHARLRTALKPTAEALKHAACNMRHVNYRTIIEPGKRAHAGSQRHVLLRAGGRSQEHHGRRACARAAEIDAQLSREPARSAARRAAD